MKFFSRLLGPKRNLHSMSDALFIKGAPCTIQGATILYVLTSPEHHSKIGKRFSAVMCENPQKTHFLLRFSRSKLDFFLDKVALFIVGASSTFK